MNAIIAATPVHIRPNKPKVGITTNTPKIKNKLPTINPILDCVFPGFTFILLGAISKPPYKNPFATSFSLAHSESVQL